MTILSRQFLLMLMLAVTAAVSGCGGGDGTVSSEFSGVVSDGPIENARVFVDLNVNGAYDNGEPYTMTDSTGTFTIRCDNDICAVGQQYFLVAEGSEELGTTDDTDNAGVDLDFVMFISVENSSDELNVTGNINPASFKAFLGELEDGYGDIDLAPFQALMDSDETDSTALFQSFIHGNRIEFMDGFTSINSSVAGDYSDGHFETTHKAVSVKIVHINDHHSHLDEEDITVEPADGFEVTAPLGGFARVITKVNELDAEDPKHTIVLHAGDAVSGTLYYTLYKGEADAEMMSYIDFDAMAVGNHEFDDGDEQLADFIDMLDFPVISANIEPASGNVLEDKIKPYIIKRVDGEPVGIIGLTIKDKTQNSSSPSDEITFIDEQDAVEAAVAELEEMGVNKIILLSHYGYTQTKALAAAVSGVDVIVDGDSHSLLGDFSELGMESAGNYPTKVKSLTNETVCIVQAYQYSYVVGDLDVSFNKDGQVTKCSGTPVMLVGTADEFTKEVEDEDVALSKAEQAEAAEFIAGIAVVESVEPDEDALAALETYSEQIEELQATVIGTAGADMIHERIPNQAYTGTAMPLGSDIAPLVAKGFLLQDPNADVCIQNAGGVRISIEDGTDITYDTAYTLLPFSNTLYEIEMTGDEIADVLEDAVDYALYGGSTGAFPYAYGLRYDVDGSAAKGSRILNLEIMDRDTEEWSDIDSDETYVVITNNYIAGGKDGYTTFQTVQDERGEGTDTYLDYAMSFVNYVKSETDAGRDIVPVSEDEHCIKSYTAPAE